jgi:hypothetical protein
MRLFLKSVLFCTPKANFYFTWIPRKFGVGHKGSTDVEGFEDHCFRRVVVLRMISHFEHDKRTYTCRLRTWKYGLISLICLLINTKSVQLITVNSLTLL